MKQALFLLYLLSVLPLSHAQIFHLQLDSTRLQGEIMLKQLTVPWDMDWQPEGWLWFSERSGRISRFHPETGALQLMHVIEDAFESTDNSGLHAMALHPDFPTVPYVYAHYTYSNYNSRLVRFTYNPIGPSLEDQEPLLDEISAAASHNGSRIVFSPEGDKLFFALGDAFREESAMDLRTYNGKILRLNLDGSIPTDNPIPGNPVWSYGHRNPQGLVMAGNGKLYNSEHGTGHSDELNIVEPGLNYGWPGVEGDCNFPWETAFCNAYEPTPPIWVWSPTPAVCGMAWYDHPAIPEWRNSILQTSLKAGEGALGQRLFQVKLNPEGDSVVAMNDYLEDTFGRLRDVLVLPDGRVFIATSNREHNGNGDKVQQADDDKIIMLFNPDFYNPSNDSSLTTQVEIYPNPIRISFSIAYPAEKGELEMELIDLNGKSVWKKTEDFGGIPKAFGRQGLSNGVYFLRMKFGDGSQLMRKLILH